ncbi:hypothetical protein PROFUN_16295 [Planoprotostelium fungivorum]|uniref:Uncharacterized protein n=1 Tax=Planoprotostelium fungivorum TaxID=1890364 RepID=A0A2P6MR94_9EUKA|nr:hypothetical protein PROFUN_16295 [Planoprotostelium fungivorum]
MLPSSFVYSEHALADNHCPGFGNGTMAEQILQKTVVAILDLVTVANNQIPQPI